MKKGEAKIEFFTNFDLIKKRYESGLVVATALFKELQKDINLQMSYVQFNSYFQKYIFEKDERFLPAGKNQKKQKTPKEKNDSEPIKLDMSATKKSKPFNPHTKGINPSDII